MEKVIDVIGLIFRVLLSLFLFVTVQLAVLASFRMAGIDSDTYEGLFTCVYSLVTVGVFLLYAFIRSHKREKLIRTLPPDLTGTVLAVVIGFGLLGLVSLYMVCADKISQYFEPVARDLESYGQSLDRYSDIRPEQIPAWDSIVYFFATFLLVPLAEELVFRGVIFGELVQRIRFFPAALISALIFGVLHGISIHVGYALICGFILALVYFYSGSIWTSFLVHAVFNLFGAAITSLLDSGIFGDMTALSNKMSVSLLATEFACIIPSIAALIIMYRLYRLKSFAKSPEPAVSFAPVSGTSVEKASEAPGEQA